MKFNIEKKNLQEGLKYCSSICNLISTSSPILSCLLFKVTKEQITIISSSSNVSGKYIINKEYFECIEEGEFLIKNKIITDLISKMDDGIIHFYKLEENQLGVKKDSWTSQLNIFDVNQFPNIDFEIPETEETKKLVFKTNEIIEIENRLSSLTAEQANPSIYSTFGFVIKDHKLNVIGTNTYKLGVIEFLTNNSDTTFNIEPHVLKLISILFKNNENVNMTINNYRLKIKYNNMILISRLREGNFPSTDIFIDTEKSTQITIDRKKLISALELGIVVDANKRSPAVDFTITEDNKLSCSFNSNEIGSSFGTLDLNDIIGEHCEFTLNVVLLTTILKNFDGEFVDMFIKHDRPVIIFKDPECKNFIQCLALIKK